MPVAAAMARGAARPRLKASFRVSPQTQRFPGGTMMLLSLIRSAGGYADRTDTIPLRWHYFPKKGHSAAAEEQIRDGNANHGLRFC